MEHHWIATTGGMLIAGLSVGFGWKHRDWLYRFLPPLDFTSARGQIAISSLAIFCFTSLRGSSFCYRLIFLLAVLAYLVDDLNSERGDHKRSLFACIGLLIYLLTRNGRLYLIMELPDVVILSVACAWLGTALISAWLQPGWNSSDAGRADTASASPFGVKAKPSGYVPGSTVA
jgi:hypothetical protein